MAYQSTTVNWDTIRSITHPKVSQKIADNITTKIPLLYFLNKMGHKEYENGGYNYVLPVFKELTTAQAYTGNSVLNAIEADPFTVAIYERKQLSVPVVATGTKMLQNSGNSPEAIVNYMTAIVEASEESMKAAMAGSSLGIFSSLTESDVGITGLQTFLTTSTTTGSVGGLSRATDLYWRHQLESSTTNFSTSGILSMNNLFWDCVRGDESPTIIVLTQSAYANLNRALTATIQYQLPSPKTQYGDLGFEHIYWHGIPVIFDSNVPANTGYFLNLKYFKLMVHSERDMVFRDWITPSDQDALVARIYWAGNLVCNNLSRQGILTGTIDTY